MRTSTSPMSHRLTQSRPADEDVAYPSDDDRAVLSDVEVIRESLSLLPIVAIEELML